MSLASSPVRAPRRKPAARLRRVLIVEDEMLVALMIEDMLAGLGYRVAGLAARLESAFSLIDRIDFEVAILDVNLGHQLVFPVAEALAARGKPFLFATGAGRGLIPAIYRERPVLQKPFLAQELRRALAELRA